MHTRKKAHFTQHTNTCEHWTSNHNNNNTAISCRHKWTLNRIQRKKIIPLTFARIYRNLCPMDLGWFLINLYANISSTIETNELRKNIELFWIPFLFRSACDCCGGFCLYFVEQIVVVVRCHCSDRMKWSVKVRQSFVR